MNPATTTRVRTHAILSRNEVQARLPLLNRIAADVARSWQAVLTIRGNLDRAERAEQTVLAEDLREELTFQVDRVNRYIEEIEALGARLQEYRRGVLNFPIEHDGRVVLACWLPEDTRVTHWHETHESFDARRSF